VEHATVETIGYLFEYPGARSLAYLPDVKRIPPVSVELLMDVDVLVVDALRVADHPTHFSLSEALAAAAKIRAKETWLTHLSHEYNEESLANSLPDGVRFAWDGLRISLNHAPSLA
jgi:phosphoribosyl 1,2-cyclic phosphate phosphodiesterase